MARLPTPGGDNGNWGTILNDFLGVEHNADGSSKHENKTANAHNASAISFTPTGTVAATDVQSAIAELQTDLPIAIVSDTAYDATAWDGVTSIAPSKNAVRDKVESLEAKVDSPSLFDVFTNKGTAAVTTADSGQTWQLVQNSTAGAGLSIISGKLTNTATVAATAAGYAQVNLGATVRRLSMEFSFGAGGVTGGSAVLAVWQTAVAPGSGVVPDSPLHLPITPGGWQYQTYTANTPTTVVSGTFTPALAQDGTMYKCDVYIDEDTATLFLPDGSTTTVTAAAIATEAGPWACFEVFQNNAATDAKASFTAVSADVVASHPGRVTSEDLHAVAKRRNLILPVVTQYSPSPSDNKTVPSSWGDVDATNLAVTFTVPDGCTSVLLEMEGWLVVSASSRVLWAYGTTVDNTGSQSIVTGAYTGRCRYTRKVTGLNVNQTYTWKWRHLYTGGTGATMNLDSANGYTATMKVTPVT